MTINELVLAMKRIQKISDETKLQRICEYLDEDHDGVVDIDDALKVWLHTTKGKFTLSRRDCKGADTCVDYKLNKFEQVGGFPCGFRTGSRAKG